MILGENPRIELNAELAKNGNDASIPLNDELQDELSLWIADRKLTGQDKLFAMPEKGMKRFNQDARAALIPVKDERGRGIDIHSLRRTFGTLLVRAGVNAKVTQTAMRHSDIRMTMDIYASCETSEVYGAVDRLPSFVPAIKTVEPMQQPIANQDASEAKPSGLTAEEEMILAIYRNRRPS